jgi:hypothetical protein
MLQDFVLSPNWLTEGRLDRELTEYRLKAFIMKVREAYRKTCLQPGWEEARFHASALHAFMESWNQAKNRIHPDLKGIDWEQKKLVYSRHQNPADWELWIEEMTEYASEEFQSLTLEGREIFLQILEDVSINPVGIEPIYQSEGYIFITREDQNTTYIFRYRLGPVKWETHQNSAYQARLLYTIKPAASQNELALKHSLIRQYPDLPNPAAWKLTTGLYWPVEQTLVPVSLHLLSQRIA